jgi:hypothetical protein
VTTYDYDELNRLTDLVNTGTAGVISSYTYELGPAGNRIRVIESGSATTERDYVYDDLYRLEEEIIDKQGTPEEYMAITYNYDGVGNRLSKIVQSQSGIREIVYIYNENDQLLSTKVVFKIKV